MKIRIFFKDYKLRIVLFSLSFVILFTNLGICDSSIGFRTGVFDSTDARLKDYYGIGPLGSLYYEWLQESGLGFQLSISLSFCSSTYQSKKQALIRLPVSILGIYKPSGFTGSLRPYIGAGYTFIYINERDSEFLEFTDGGFPSSSIGYDMLLGLDYQLSEHYSISWQSDLSIVKVISKLNMQNMDYGGVSSTIGITYHF